MTGTNGTHGANGAGAAGGLPGRPIRVAILNDFPVVIAGLAALLEQAPGRFEVVTAVVGQPVPAATADLVLYDVFATHGDLAEVLAQSEVKVVVFTSVLNAQSVVDALRAGAAGYLYKGVSTTQLVEALSNAHRSSTPVVALRQDAESTPAPRQWPGMGHDLTEREAEVVALISSGFSNLQISHQTYLSINSVKTYIRLAYRKMGVESRSQAVLWGIQHGLGQESTST